MLLARLYVSPFGLLVGWTRLTGPPRRPLVLSRMSVMFIGMNLELFLNGLFQLLGAVSRSSVDDFWSIWSRNGEVGLFRAYSKAGGPTELAALPFLAEFCYGFVTGVWEAELLVAGMRADCIGLAMVMR